MRVIDHYDDLDKLLNLINIIFLQHLIQNQIGGEYNIITNYNPCIESLFKEINEEPEGMTFKQMCTYYYYAYKDELEYILIFATLITISSMTSYFYF